MLNKREIQVILIFYENPGVYFTADQLAQKLGASRRTIQNDMKMIRQELGAQGSAKLLSKRAKGSCIVIENQDAYADWINKLYLQNLVEGEDLSYPLQRIAQIIYILLGRFRAMPLHELEDELYVSGSTLLKDFKGVQENLKSFRLTLVKENNRFRIAGQEIDKRRCLAQNSFYLAHIEGEGTRNEDHIDLKRLNYLKNLLLDAFMASQYYISDKDFNNAVLTLNIMLHRIQKSFFIQKEEVPDVTDIQKEIEISQKIFTDLGNRLFCNIPYEEVRFFAVYLKGQEIFKNHEIISAEMDDFIRDAFVKIKHTYGVDFTNNISLRIAIALHCIPLLVRLQCNMQVHNKNLMQVKENFPLGFEIAQYFAFLLRGEYQDCAPADEEEISLLAAHFYGSLLEMRQNTKQMKVLVISSLKASMTMLLRAMLIKWFSREIVTLDFIQVHDMAPDLLDDYDVFLTTEKNEFYEKGIAMYINQFPTQRDQENIRLLLDGFSNLDDVVRIFDPHLFFSLNHADKGQLLEILAGKAETEYGLSGLLEEVKEREGIGSTFFTRGIAIPHPLHAVSSDTFVASCVVQEPVKWDEDGDVANIILLIHIGKNNPRSFQLWDYLAKIFEDKKLVESLVANPTYDFFIGRLRQLLNGQFSNSFPG